MCTHNVTKRLVKEAKINSLPVELKYWPIRRYMDIYKKSLDDIEEFWEQEARKLEWFRTWDKILEWDPPFAKWFPGGLINASYLCVDRHLKTWRRNKVAIYWEGENSEERTLSYSQLHREVNRLAVALRKLGVKDGDRIALYLPMIPELPVAMLASARIGAIHTVIFSGFSSMALADRINDTEAKVLITADGGYRRGKAIKLKEIADLALENAPSVEKVIVVKRRGQEVKMKEDRDIWYHELVKNIQGSIDPMPIESTHPLYILYTSGTTGKPKGIVHSTGGYLVFINSMYQWVFDIREDSVYWCTADVGWVTGHSSIVYAPLMHGASIVVYEGAPDYPKPDRWWEIIEKYKVTIFYTSPTAIRMFMKYGEEWPKKHDLSSLTILGSVGEPINPEAWLWYFKHIGGERCPIVDTWWQTETGGVMISPAPGIGLVPLKPGSATFPLPGIDAEVVDDNGKPTPPGVRGYLVIKKPWPAMLMTLYKDPERYKQTYWSRFPGVYYTGDYCIKDEDGYFWLLGRADEVLKVAGHRMGTMELESAAISHPAVAEAAVIGKPHEIKGESIVIFAILKQDHVPSEGLHEELREHMRKTIGPIAMPDEIYFVSKLPKTRSGKIMRRVLKAVVSDAPIGDVTTLEDEASVEEVKQVYEEFKKIIGHT
ncbi:acetate--CoA ligase [Candidatus Bathyarchaeota archaeon]|nr:acetate--CoA ligase [Candidatus Bathyarchaeota archaeon]